MTPSSVTTSSSARTVGTHEREPAERRTMHVDVDRDVLAYAADCGLVPGRSELSDVGFRADDEAARADEKATGAARGAGAAAPARHCRAGDDLSRTRSAWACEPTRAYCDVMSGRDPAGGVLISLPPHPGPVTLTFDLHNRHTYSEELVKANRAYARYTAVIGALTMDNTLISRAAVQSEFRKASDLVERIGGGAGPGGVKAVAPTGTEHDHHHGSRGREPGQPARREADRRSRRGAASDLHVSRPPDCGRQQRDDRVPAAATAEARPVGCAWQVGQKPGE